ILAILCRQAEQHREWMIRSYVLTFGFVTIRILDSLLDMEQMGTLVERMTAASWLGWIVPLVLTEAILQGRKIFSQPVNATHMQAVSVDNTVPEPMPFDLRGSESSYLRRP